MEFLLKATNMKVLGEGWPKDDFEARILPTIDQMTQERGWIINSYAQLEYLAADLVVKCRKFETYGALNRLPLPFGIDNRIS